MANVFEKKISFNVVYDTVNGVTTNPRIDEPDFSVGGLEFRLDARKIKNVKIFGVFYDFYAVYLDINEASKKTLMPEYEIDVEEVSLDYTFNDGSSRKEVKGPLRIQGDAVEILQFTTVKHCDVKLVMEFLVIQSSSSHFVDTAAAKEKLSDCKIVLVDDENKEVFAHKNILATSSSFFRTVFYGDSQEKDQGEVKLSNVKQKDFVEYLCFVYPLPGHAFVFKRLDTLLTLANRFQNDTLVSSIESFLMEMKNKALKDKHQILLWADAYNMKTLFSATLKSMTKYELKKLNTTMCKKFKKDNIELLLVHIANQFARTDSRLTEITVMNLSDSDVFTTTISYKVSFKTIAGEKTPRIDKPNFTVGGLKFHLSIRNSVHKKIVYVVSIELSETSKKTLMNGYEIELSSFELAGRHGDWTFRVPIRFALTVIGDVPVALYSYDAECYSCASITMKFRDVFPHRLQFTDAEEAKTNSSDCKILLKDDGNKEVFVHKYILAFRSPFFKTLFFGDFKEKDQDVVTLSGVMEEDFLEYLFCVYPPPIRPFAFKRIDALLCLADLFQNDFLTASIEKFLKNKGGKTLSEKKETLFLADAYKMPELFRTTLKTMDKTELRTLDLAECKTFEEDNVKLLLSYFVAQL